MEDRGYLVAHPTLIDPKGHAPAEQQHITHKVNAQTQVNMEIGMDRNLWEYDIVIILMKSIFFPLVGATGGQWHPKPPQLCQEKPL